MTTTSDHQNDFSKYIHPNAECKCCHPELWVKHPSTKCICCIVSWEESGCKITLEKFVENIVLQTKRK